MTRLKIFTWLILSVLLQKAGAQLTYTPVALRNLDASFCWNVRLQVQGENNRVELHGKISDDNGKLLIECVSDKLFVRGGIQNLDPTLVQTTSIKFFDDAVKKHLERHGRLPDGRYQFCTTAKTVRDAEEVGEDCISLTQTNTDTVVKPRLLKKLPEQIQFYGNASIEHVYSSRQGTNQVMPPHLMRVQAQPGVSFYNVPVSMNLYYTTERTYARPNQFAISFQFDEQKFKDNLRRLIEQKIMEETKLNMAAMGRQYEQVAELGNINDQLKGLSPNTSEIGDLEAQIKSGDYANLDETIANLTQQATEAKEKINYDQLKGQYVDAKNQLLDYVPKDSLEEAEKKRLTDSVDARLQYLEAQKDSVLKSDTAYQKKLQAAENRKKKLAEITSRLKQLKAVAQQVQQLTEKKGQLEGLQKQLEGVTQSNYGELGRLGDPTVLKENLVERGLFTGMNKLFFGVRQLSIGTVYPSYSPLILNGLQVQGGALELNPGLFYLNITGGNTHLGARNLLDIFKSAYQRWMIGGRIGIGKMERSHFYINYIHSFDKPNTLPADVTSAVRPQQNDVLGVELQLTFWKGRIKLLGEGAGVGFNRNRNDELLKVENTYYEKIPALLKPNLSTSYDYAYTVRGEFNFFKGSLISAYTEYIGPGYTSFGVPFLRNDVLRYGGRIEQSVWKNRIKLNAKYRYEIDNLIESKRFTTTTHFFGGGFSFNQRKLPTFKVDYTGNYRTGTTATQLMHAVNASSGYSYKIAKTNMRTNVNYQLVLSNADSISFSDYTLHNVMVNQSVSFKVPVTLIANVGYNQMQNIITTNRQIQVGAGVISMPFKNFNAGVNVDFAKSFTTDFRVGTQVDLSYFFLKHLTLSVNCRYNHYKNEVFASAGFNDVILTTRLAVNW